MKNKKLCALFLAIIFMLNMSSSISFDVFAEIASHTYTYDNYEVEYAVLNEWEGNQSIKITVRNTGTESILNWAVAYRAGGEINGLWNAVSPKENIIKNAGYNYEIVPNGSVSFGYTLSGENLELPEKFEIVSKRANVTEGYEVNFDIYDDWGDGFQGAVTITNTGSEPLEAWTLSFDADFTIGNSWGGRIIDSSENSYTIASEMWTNPIMPNSSSSFGFTAAKEADTKAAADNFVLTSVKIDENAVPENPNEDIDYELDTDKDGLPNYYEDILGTDKNRGDTDGDGLSDGYEVLYLGTDPLKADTDENGINDGDEDLDKDGLTNIKECELGTDPNTADTDGDGLSDGAEANTHGTDPLKYDTDGDNVSDGDEITLGLDPNSSSTDGIPDSERTFTQTVSSDSEVLSAVNDDKETPFKVSLEIKAAGVAENNVYARESGYSNAIENSAIIGIAPEFVYKDGLSVEEVTVKFELENSVINNTLGTYTDESYEFKGIKRLNVFMFFEDVNMLLPVETFHDEEANTVYTKTDRVGTYCLVDMEIFLDNLDKQLNGENEPEAGIEVQSEESEAENTLDNNTVLSYNINKKNLLSNNSGNPDDFDVVFLIDCRSVSKDEEYAVIVRNVIETADTVFVKSPKARVRIIAMNSTVDEVPCIMVSHIDIGKNGSGADKNFYLTDLDDVYKALEFIKEHVNGSKEDCNVSDAIKCLYETYRNTSRAVHAFCIVQPEGALHEHGDAGILGKIKKETKVKINTVFSEKFINKDTDNGSDTSSFTYAKNISFITGGKSYFIYDDSSEFMLKQIYNNPEVENGYKAIIGTGYRTVVLNQSLQDNYDMCQNKAHYDKHIDTDLDGLADYQEIMFSHGLIDDNDQSHIELLTFGQIIDNIVKMSRVNGCNNELFYVEKGLERYKGITGEDGKYPLSLWNVKILPIISDPTSEDGDGDGILDINEKWNGIDERYKNISPLKSDTVESLYPELRLDKLGGENKSGHRFYCDIKNNDITFTSRCDFSNLSYEQRNLIENALNDYWSNIYYGNIYDFYPGMSINAKFEITNESKGNRLHFNFWEENDRSSFSRFNDFIDGINVLLFNISNTEATINIYKNYSSSLTIAHELGHSFGLSDAYGELVGVELGENNVNDGYDLIFASEIDNEHSEIVANYEIMKNGESVCSNDIEMILEAISTGKYQFFTKTKNNNISKMIKSPELLYYSMSDNWIYSFTYGESEFKPIIKTYNRLEWGNSWGEYEDEYMILLSSLRNKLNEMTGNQFTLQYVHELKLIQPIIASDEFFRIALPMDNGKIKIGVSKTTYDALRSLINCNDIWCESVDDLKRLSNKKFKWFIEDFDVIVEKNYYGEYTYAVPIINGHKHTISRIYIGESDAYEFT